MRPSDDERALDWWAWPFLAALMWWGIGRYHEVVVAVVDWDIVLSVCLGIAAIGYALVEHRRTSKLDDLAQEFGERLAALEANADDARTVEHRIAQLEARAEYDSRLEERIADYAERLARLEVRLEDDDTE